MAKAPKHSGKDVKTSDASSQERIRIGVILGGSNVRAWEHHILEALASQANADLVLCVISSFSSDEKRVPFNHLVWRLAGHLDRLLFPPAHDAMEWMEASKLLEGVPVVRMTADKSGEWLSEHIRKAGVDLLVYLHGRMPDGDVLQACPLGVWRYHFGDRQSGHESPPGYWEVMTARPTTEVSLRRMTGSSGGEILSRVVCPTYPYSVTGNRNQACWEGAMLLPRAIGRKMQPKTIQSTASRSLPDNTTALMHAGRHGGRILRRFTERLLTREQWFLMFRRGEAVGEGWNDFKTVMPPRDRFWADPSVVQHGGEHYVFFEEMIYKRGKAHIAALRIDERDRVHQLGTVLSESWHLSYPSIFEYDGIWYMVPESLEARCVPLYRCTSFPDTWERVATLVDDLDVVDPTLHFDGERWWLFAIVRETAGGSDCTSLHLFHSRKLVGGTWHPHRGNPVVADCRRARPAGPLFSRDGKLFRPSQDCSRRYGHAININEILELSPRRYRERRVDRILPNWRNDILGTHHLAVGEGMTVIDAVRRIWKLP